MSKTKFYWVDSFTNEPFKGNPAGVCLLDEPLAEDQMQRIAAEINLSETAFTVPTGDGKYHLRWFTPTCEIELCGHATLAAAKALWHSNPSLDDTIKFETQSGLVTVSREQDDLCMDFPLLATEPCQPPNQVEIKFADQVIACATSGSRLIVELANADDVINWNFDRDFVLGLDCNCLVLTAAAKEPGFDFVSRVFVPKKGIDEDPVTGSAHCALTDYWNIKTNQLEFAAKQVSARSGILKLKINQQRVLLTGEATIFLSGDLEL